MLDPKILKYLFKLTPERLYWALSVGLPKRFLTEYRLVADNFKQIKGSVFFLSTGRTGTNWFARLLKRDKSLAVFHEPHPPLVFQSKYLYEIRVHKNYPRDLVLEIASELFKTARTYYLLYSYRAGKRYVETNNHLTFFAPAILNLLPGTKFVHLYRHPGDFVRSGLQRGWYAPGNEKVSKLITHPDPQVWQGFNRIQKIAWLWRETNLFIENFKLSLDKSQIYNLDFSRRSVEDIVGLTEFIGAKIPVSHIKKMLGMRVNTQRFSIPPYKQWDRSKKEQIWEICGDLAGKYGYEI